MKLSSTSNLYRFIDKKSTGTIPRKIFGFAGQSNVSGAVQISLLEPQYKYNHPNVKFYKFGKNEFANLNPDDNTTFQNPEQTNANGFQFYLYPQIATAINDTAYCVHYAVLGSSLAVGWLSTTRGSYFDEFVFRVKNSVNIINNCDGATPEVKFIYWQQGEADAANLTQANNYQTNLTDFINNFRTLTGLANVPFLIGKLNVNVNATTCPYFATIRTAQVAVCQGGGSAIAGVHIVDLDDCELRASDMVHYTQAGFSQIADNVLAVAIANNLFD